ncbi:polysaccharide export inner-membrane protein, BexC/CtrB/KpsE family [compost metagenome]
MVGASNRPGDKFQKTTLEVISHQIAELQKLLTGTTKSSLSSRLKDYELLKLKEQFVEQLYTVARASFEEARRKLGKQQLYVVTVVPPQLPDAATYPKPVQEAGVVFLSLLVVWAIGCLLIATVRDSAQSG